VLVKNSTHRKPRASRMDSWDGVACLYAPRSVTCTPRAVQKIRPTRILHVSRGVVCRNPADARGVQELDRCESTMPSEVCGSLSGP